jgi:hypothetical protein
MRPRAALAAALIALAVAPAPHVAQDAPWRVGLRSFGPVRFGMTLAQASAALHEPLQLEDAEGDCGYTYPASLPPGTSFMVVEGRIARVDVDSGATETLSGARIGSTETEIRRLYPGRIRVRAHPYTGPEGHYLVFTPRESIDAGFGLIFETDGRRVTSYRAGLHGPVQYIEGCL